MGAANAHRPEPSVGPGPAVPGPGLGPVSVMHPGPPSSLPAADPSGGPPDPALADLCLDQVFRAIEKDREYYRLGPLFSTIPPDPDTVRYRQEVAEDLQRPGLRQAVDRLARDFRDLRRDLLRAEKRHHPLQQARVRLGAAQRYADALVAFAAALDALDPGSRGLRALRSYLRGYLASASFRALRTEAHGIVEALDRVAYVVQVRDRRVEVAPFRGEVDLSAEVAATFDRFRESADADHGFQFHDAPELSSVEEQIVDRVALLDPEPFRRLRAFAEGYRDWVDPVVERFDREVQFYVGYLELVDRLTSEGREFCMPVLDGDAPDEHAEGIFDLALTLGSGPSAHAIVPNDFACTGPGRILVVTGPNQGGKTTFARAFGQLHYLALLGLPVPARSARLAAHDRVYTHFATGEGGTEEQGRLRDDLTRLRSILDRATARSVVVLNESFASTTVADALLVGREILGRVAERGMVAVCVTFLDELSRLGPETVSLVAAVAPDDPSVRTFRIERRPADGRAYAVALAQKHGLAYSDLRPRLGP